MTFYPSFTIRTLVDSNRCSATFCVSSQGGNGGIQRFKRLNRIFKGASPLARLLGLPTISVQSASKSGARGRVPAGWLEKMNPGVIVIGEAPSEHLHYYDGYNVITQNTAGDITFDCQTAKTHVYASEPNYSVDYLDDEQMPNEYGFYVGTLKTKG